MFIRFEWALAPFSSELEHKDEMHKHDCLNSFNNENPLSSDLTHSEFFPLNLAMIKKITGGS